MEEKVMNYHNITHEDMKNGENCICVSTFEEMIIATIALLSDKKTLSENAQEMMAHKYSLENNQQKVMKAINSLYENR